MTSNEEFCVVRKYINLVIGTAKGVLFIIRAVLI